MPIDTDLRHVPLVYSRFTGDQTVHDIDTYIARMTPVHLSKKPWVGIAFMESYSRDPEVLKKLAGWMKETKMTIREHCLGMAMVSPSTGFRFVLSSVFLMQPLSCPYSVCRNLDEAFGFVRSEAAKQGVSLPQAKPAWIE